MKKFTFIFSALLMLASSVMAKEILPLFSINPEEMVRFSPGNLQYNPTNDEYRFAPNQTDYIGNNNPSISSSNNAWIDLFGWGTGLNPTNISTNYRDYLEFNDWGLNKIGEYAPNTWRTLSYSEWYYLMFERDNAANLKGIAQVNGVNGLILLPDNWESTDSISFKSGVNDYPHPSGYSDFQKLSSAEWDKIEDSGAVFLPAGGYRDGTDVSQVQNIGHYWAADWQSFQNAMVLNFKSNRINCAATHCSDGESVRLVSTETYSVN